MLKTIFITSCHPLISRNILSTGILSMLQKQGMRVVLIVPETKKEFFTKEFSTAIVEGVKIQSKKREGLMRYLSLAALDTRTLDIKRKTEMKGSGSLLVKILSNRLGFYALRCLENHLYRKYIFNELFQKYNPSSVFCTDIQSEIDVALLVEAKRKHIKTVGMVRSWDNLTSKGIIRAIPDKLVVWNDIVKDEAIHIQNISKDIIEIIGIPHYDAYSNFVYNKEEFFKKIGADMQKKLVLCVPIGDRYLTKNTVDKDVVDILDKNLSEDYQILVRLPPGDYVRELENNHTQFKRINVLYDRAKTNPDNIKATEIGKDDDVHLAQTLHWADMVVSGPSTMVIDATFMKKPVILFGFDGYDKRTYYDSIYRYYEYNNFTPIIESGGVRFATTIEEFKEYIKNPNLNPSSIEDIARKEVGYMDGKCTQRLFNVLIS